MFKTKEFGAAAFGPPCDFVLESLRMAHIGLNRLSRSRLYVTSVAVEIFQDFIGASRKAGGRARSLPFQQISCFTLQRRTHIGPWENGSAATTPRLCRCRRTYEERKG